MVSPQQQAPPSETEAKDRIRRVRSIGRRSGATDVRRIVRLNRNWDKGSAAAFLSDKHQDHQVTGIAGEDEAPPRLYQAAGTHTPHSKSRPEGVPIARRTASARRSNWSSCRDQVVEGLGHWLCQRAGQHALPGISVVTQGAGAECQSDRPPGPRCTTDAAGASASESPSSTTPRPRDLQSRVPRPKTCGVRSAGRGVTGSS